jgi:uncharacterized protein (DUF2384 family)
MELTIKVDDKEGPFLIELLKKFSFVQEITTQNSVSENARIDHLWQHKASKVFATRADFALWLNTSNSVINGQKPTDLLVDDAGLRLVQKLLDRIAHGIMA